jgi:hypothetical protein
MWTRPFRKCRSIGIATLLVVASVAFTASPAAAGAGADASALVLMRVNGTQVAVALPDAQDIAFGTTYEVCCANGVESTRTFSTGWTIATLLLAGGIDPSRVESIAISRPASPKPPVVLAPRDFDPTQPGGLDFPQRSCMPAVIVGGTWSCPAFVYLASSAQPTLSFFRPERSSPPSDVNRDDVIDSQLGLGLILDVTTNDHLDVSVHADHTKVRAGEPVHFTATSTSRIDGEQLSFRWTFTDGVTRSGADVTHAFAHPGTYTATAIATGTLGSGGVSAPLTLTVGQKAGAPGPGGGNPAGEPTTGGDRGPSIAHVLVGQGRVGNGTRTGSGNGTGLGGPGTANASGTSNGSASHALGATNRAAKSAPIKHPDVVQPAGVEVRGELLAAAGDGGVAGISGGATKRATGPGGVSVGHHWNVPWSAMLGVALVLGLFALGGASEHPLRARSRV